MKRECVNKILNWSWCRKARSDLETRHELGKRETGRNRLAQAAPVQDWEAPGTSQREESRGFTVRQDP